MFQQHSSEEEAHTPLVSTIKINQETGHCDPSEAQTEHNNPESNQLLIGVSSSLTLETMLPRILSSVCVATYLLENKQEKPRKISAIGSKTRHLIVYPEELSRIWRVGINMAQETLKATTQRGIHTAVHPLPRRYHTDHFSLRYRLLNTQFYLDTVFTMSKSPKGNKWAQVFTAKDFIWIHPMNSKE